MSSVPRSYPPTQPHKVMNSTPRAHTEPLPSAGGFIKSVMRYHNMNDDLDEGLLMLSQPEKKITQEEQDELDEKARKRAMRNLVNSWQERLQLISVITTFFASTEAAMLVNTKPTPGSSDWGSNILKASNASFLGALIVHVYAAVLSFLGAFLLIRYKLKEATREEMIAEGIKLVNSPLGGTFHNDVEPGLDNLGLQQTLTGNDAQSTLYKNGAPSSPPQTKKKRNSFSLEPPIIMSANPHLEQVGPFMSSVSSHLLSRTHSLCVFLTAIGFVLAIVGIICYAWASQPVEVSIFASACLGGVALAMTVLLAPF